MFLGLRQGMGTHGGRNGRRKGPGGKSQWFRGRGAGLVSLGRAETGGGDWWLARQGAGALGRTATEHHCSGEGGALRGQRQAQVTAAHNCLSPSSVLQVPHQARSLEKHLLLSRAPY